MKDISKKSNLVLLVVSIFISFALFELGAMILTHMGYFRIDKPGYSFDSVKKKFWVDRNPDFGIWHDPGSEYLHRKSCFAITYRANSYGARDKERPRESKDPRVVMIGDSFVEGYGVPDGGRMTDFLENQTGIAHLNFGTGGHFGTTQYYLLYKTLAKNFSHDMLLVGILPDNDFLDNDFETGKKIHYFRYRPYFVGEYPNYQLVYYNDQKLGGGKGWGERLWGNLRGLLRGYTYSYNAIERLLDTRRVKSAMPDPKLYSGFYDFKEKDYQLLEFTLEKIIDEAKGKTVVFFTIPVLADLKRYDQKGESPLSERLKVFSEAHGVNFVDLLPLMHDASSHWEDYFLTCDNHWSSEGNRTASQILKDKIPYEKMRRSIESQAHH